jgi:sugar lactone lactonase YvrE
MSASPTTIVLAGIPFPEAPRWHNGRVYFSDLYAGTVTMVDQAGSAEVIARLERPSGIGWMPDGEMLVVAMNKQALIRVDAGKPAETAHELGGLADWSCNDMAIDRRGRAYVGQMGLMWGIADPDSDPEDAQLLLVDADGVRFASPELLSCANGIIVADEGRTLIVAETIGKRLTAFTIQPDGTLADRRLIAELGDMPDGICGDAEGGVWAACLTSGRFVRVDRSGALTDEVVLPEGRKAIACVLGGEDRRSLFLCTNSTYDPDEVMVQRGGRIEALRVAVPGAGFP